MTKTIAVIGGSGVYSLPFLTVTERITQETRYGKTSEMIEVGTFSGKRVAFLARHGASHGILPHRVNYRANIAALAELSPVAVIAVGSVGGITPRCPTGSIVLPDQLIDYTYGRSSTFSDDEEVWHVDFTVPFDHDVRQKLLNAAELVNESLVDGGVYAVTQGPRLETAAEIQRLARDGADIVGMTAMPEAVLAREKQLPYALLSPVINAAAGIEDSAQGIAVDSLIDQVTLMGNRIVSVIQTFIEQYK